MPVKRREVLINQADREFVPFVTVVQAGTSVRFPDNDAMRHHVYSYSPVKTLQIKLDSNTAATPVIFDKTGMVPHGCNIHDCMEAYVIVVETPYFSKTDTHGTATLAKRAHGNYELRVWHPYIRLATQQQALAVKSDGRIKASFRVELNVPRRKVKPHMEKEAC